VALRCYKKIPGGTEENHEIGYESEELAIHQNLRYTMPQNYQQELDIDGRIILKCIVMKWYGTMLTGFIWIKMGTILNMVLEHRVPCKSVNFSSGYATAGL
jgi:hypothetical protein